MQSLLNQCIEFVAALWHIKVVTIFAVELDPSEFRARCEVLAWPY